MDATLVRATLVPAFMRLAGEANWWAPRWMKRIYERFGFSESEPGAGPTRPGSGPRSTSGDPDVLAASLGLVDRGRGLEERVELTGVEESTPLG